MKITLQHVLNCAWNQRSAIPEHWLSFPGVKYCQLLFSKKSGCHLKEEFVYRFLTCVVISRWQLPSTLSMRKKPNQTIFLCWCGVKHSFNHAAARPAAQFLFPSTISQPGCWRNHLSRTRWELFTMQKSCLILPKSHFWKQTLEPPPQRRSSAPWPLWPNGCQNLLQQLQLWILTVSGCLTLCSDRTSWEEPLNSSTSLLTHSWEISVTAITSTCLFEEKRQKPAALGGLYPPGAFMLVQVSRKAITTWSLTCEFTSTALKACPAAGSTTGYSCVGIRDSFIEWRVTAYFLIWINYVHFFFSPQFLSRLTGRPESQNGCNQIKLSKATVSTDTGVYSAHFAQNNPIAVSPFHTKLVLTASDNQKFSKSTLTLRISLLNYFTSI